VRLLGVGIRLVEQKLEKANDQLHLFGVDRELMSE
jgi:hypothetical protein